MSLEILKRFLAWTKIKYKIYIEQVDDPLYFYEREIWWCALGANIGFEQDGKNDTFERPVLILKKFNKDLLWVLPLTSKDKTANPFYCETEYLGERSFIILSQIRSISSKRLLRKIRKLPEKEFQGARKRIASYL